jgi:hypothetical protein
MLTIRPLVPAALLAFGLLASASASADDTAAPPPVAAAPAMAAPVAPGYSPAPPGYPPAYMMYPVYGAPPPYWMPIAPPTERRSNALRTTGIVLFAAGGLVSAVGTAIFAATVTTPCVFFDAGSTEGELPPSPSPAAASGEHVRSARQALNGCDTSPMVGLGIMGAGLLTAVAGLPLFVLGSKQVPASQPTGKLVPEVSVGAANASFRWTF